MLAASTQKLLRRAPSAQGRGLFAREMRAQSAIGGALDGRLRLIRDVGDERRRLPWSSPIPGPRDRDAPLAARQRDIGEPSLFVRVAVGGGDDAVLERGQEHMLEFQPFGAVHGHEPHGRGGAFAITARRQRRVIEELAGGMEV
jgi:hypothetical protein